jgi:hypothetical protein
VQLGAISNFSPKDALPKIGSRSPCDVHSRRPEEIGAVTAEPASVLTF